MAYIDTGLKQKAQGQKIEFYHIPTDQTIQFKAFLTDFNDQFTSNWESEEVYGRMDPIQTFKSTKREITLGFDVVAGSAEEAQNNLSSISALIKFLYPTYDNQRVDSGEAVSIGANTIAAAPLFKVKFMNLISRSTSGGTAKTNGLVCTCNGFGFKPELEPGFVVDNRHGQSIYPKLFNVSMTLTVLHDHSLGFTTDGKAAMPLFPYGQGGGTPGTFLNDLQGAMDAAGAAAGGSGMGSFLNELGIPAGSNVPPSDGSSPGRFDPDSPVAKAKTKTITKRST